MTDAAFSSEYVRCFPLMMSYARRQFGINDPENVVQQVWAKAWERREQYDGRASISTWAYAIMHNLLRDIRRSPAHRLEFVAETADSPAPARNYADAIDAEILLRAMTPNERAAVTLYHLEEMSFEEMAEVTGRCKQTLKTLAFRGRHRAAAFAAITNDRSHLRAS